MPFQSASPLVTSPQPSSPHRPHPQSSSQHQSSTSAKGLGGLFSGAGLVSTSWATMPSIPSHSTNVGSSSGGAFASPALSGPCSSQVQWGVNTNALPASIQWGSNSSYTSPAKQAQSSVYTTPATTPSSAQPLPDKTRKSESKRKRFDDEDDDMDDSGPFGSPSRRSPSVDLSTPGQGRQLSGRSLVPKRLRAGLGGLRGMGLDSGTAYGGQAFPQQSFIEGRRTAAETMERIGEADKDDSVDLGKMLASLDKPHLLSLLSSLLAQNPSLMPTVRSLLPLPTLDFVNASLDSYEASIKAALPFEAGKNESSNVRPEYAWNRLRGPVAELVSGIQSWMDFFTSREAQEAGQGKEVRPTIMFELLHTITLRVIKIQRDMLPIVSPSILTISAPREESSRTQGSLMTTQLLSSLPPALRSPASPNVILTSLLPLLLQAWESLIRRISHDLNVEGKMYGREVIVGWLRGCETLRHEVDQRQQPIQEDQKRLVVETIQNCLKEIDQGFRREIGWCVGVY